MMAFFFTMPMSRMMPISEITCQIHAEKQECQKRARACRWQCGKDGDGMDVTFVENSENDVDREQCRQN